MSEPTKQQTGDGQDNYGQAAKQAANVVRQADKNAAQKAATKGVEATQLMLRLQRLKRVLLRVK